MMNGRWKFDIERRLFLKSAAGASAAGLVGYWPRALALDVDPWTQADEIVSRIQAPTIPRRAFPITRFGARGDGMTDCTAAIASAIAACVAAGGGRVLIPEGTFLTGAIRLRSRVELHLVAGATLLFSTDPRQYPNVLTRWEGNDLFNYSPLVYAFRETDIAITGEGDESILDGQASTSTWWSFTGPAGADSLRLKQQGAVPGMTPIEQRVYGIDANGVQHYLRPPLIGPYGCENVLIEGVTLHRSPFWQMQPLLCKSVIIRNVTASSLGPNNDGCDPESCTDVLIEDCTFDTGDDCIAIKAGRGFDAMIDNGVRSRLGALPPWVNFPTTSSNLVIRNNTMISGHGGVTLGSEMSGGVDHVFAENIDMLSNTLDIALRFKTNTWRGGFMTNYYARNINVPNGVSASNGVITIDYFYSANASDRPQDAGPFRPFTDNINVSNLNVTGGNSRWAFNLRGYSAVNTPCGTTNACVFGPGSKQIIDSIQRLSVSDSTFKVATATTGTFPFGDQIQAVKSLSFTNVARNGVPLPDGTYTAA
ncbi:MAG TPA: glycoside hydrolase family 28 protein [Casimicrobiaceae bacterium]|nr:glycoside hydrolase family 28 protein [Casimicrobiaceae bacterium]